MVKKVRAGIYFIDNAKIKGSGNWFLKTAQKKVLSEFIRLKTLTEGTTRNLFDRKSQHKVHLRLNFMENA